MPETAAEGAGLCHVGQIVNFYSYKGGTGRTMALANIAWILASSGHQVLAADWDLEAPGLHHYFRPFLAETTVRDAPGITGMVQGYERKSSGLPAGEETEGLLAECAQVKLSTLPVRWDFPGPGCLDFLPSGRQNHNGPAISWTTLDWDNFLHRGNGAGEFLAAVSADMKRHYDYVLIDSRTGLSGIADICTTRFADVLVDCFTLSAQGIEGAALAARSVQELHSHHSVRILPVPMRVDPAEHDKTEAGRAEAERRLGSLLTGMTDAQRRHYWAATGVPYRPYFSHEETLAVFADMPGSATSLLSSFERLAAQITEGRVTALPPVDDDLRERALRLFTRQPAGEIVVEFGAEDQVWADWVSRVLQGTGVSVRQRHLNGDGGNGGNGTGGNGTGDPACPTLTVISAAYLTRHRPPDAAPRAPQALAIYVTVTRPLPEFPAASVAFLAGLTEADAAGRLLALLGVGGPALTGIEGVGRGRYPGSEPRIIHAPVRNTRFTGREADLRQLRQELMDCGTAVVLPVALQGLGGVGKTQIALEYVHRFRTDYDVIWWLECGQPQFIDVSLLDLAAELQKSFGVSVQPTASSEDGARSVLRQLEDGQATRRWLLVYDNADDAQAVERYLPSGSAGHVIITSRNPAWAGQARPLPIEVFTRAESVAHLRQRNPAITPEQAGEVAEAVGDLPLAVASAGALLAQTGFTVPDYLRQLETQAPRALSISHLADYSQTVSQTWDLSLNLLRERSPAAARLFELCSVMSPQIAAELLYSAAMAEVLKPFDPALSEAIAVGRVVQEINRLALIKMDAAAGRVHVHRIVQAIVRDRMSDEETASARRAVHRVLTSARPRGDVDDPRTWPSFRLIWPHLLPSQASASREEQVRQLLIDRVRYLWQHHDLERGHKLATEVQDVWESMLLAEPSPAAALPLRRQLLHLRFNLGNILRDQGRYADAHALDEAVLSEQRELLGPDHPYSLMTAGSLAGDLRALGRYHDALRMDEAIYPVWAELYGEDHARTLTAAHNLAVSCRLTADVPRALELDEDTLTRRRATLGPLHPRTLDSASGLARDLMEMGRYNEAGAAMDAVWQQGAEALGADSVTALNAQVLLGITLRSAGRPQDAEPHLQRAAERLALRFGESSTAALSGRLSSAVNQLSRSNAAAAGPEISAVLARYAQKLGPAHPHALIAQVDLAAAQRANGQPAQALQTARAAADGLADGLGRGHPYTLAALMSVGVLLADQGDLDSAEAVESGVAERLELALWPGHPDVLRSRANLMITRQQRGDPRAAAQREQETAQLEAVIGPGHPDIAALRQGRRLMRTLDPQPF